MTQERAPRLTLRMTEVAEQLGVGTSTVHRWVQSGRLMHHKVGGVVLIRPADIEAFLEAHREGRCIARSSAAGRSGLVIVNLFAHRHTDPRVLRRATDPVGPANDEALRLLTSTASRTIAAWGAGGRLHRRSRAIAPLLNRPLCLGMTRRGEQRHCCTCPPTRRSSPGLPLGLAVALFEGSSDLSVVTSTTSATHSPSRPLPHVDRRWD